MLVEKLLLHARNIALKQHLAVHRHVGKLLQNHGVVNRLRRGGAPGIKVDTILSKNYCYINLGQTNPQVLSLEYKFGKNSNDSCFTYLKNWITINDGSQHIYYYEMEKPEEKGYNLYLKITVKNYYDKQKLTVESTDSQFNFYLLIGLIIASSAIIVIIVVILSFYCIYKSKVDTNNPSSYDVIFVPVGPSDF